MERVLPCHTRGAFSERVHHSHGGLVLGKGGKVLRGATQEQKRLVECTSEEAAGKLGAEIPFGKVFRRTRRRVVVEGNVGKASREGNPDWGIEEGGKSQRHLNTV